MNLQHILIWLIPAVLASVFLSLLQWNTKEPLYLKEIIKTIALGVIMGYFTNKICIIESWEKWVSVYSGLTSFLAQWIGALILKNKWIILKAKTGMDGSDAENKK